MIISSIKVMRYDLKTQENNEDLDCIYFSVDLQKVAMLSLIDMYKFVLFTSCIICFNESNESFVPFGRFTELQKSIVILKISLWSFPKPNFLFCPPQASRRRSFLFHRYFHGLYLQEPY